MTISSFLATTDWDATGSMIQGLGTAGGAIAVYAAAKLGFSTWRRQKQAEHKRDQDLPAGHQHYGVRRIDGVPRPQRFRRYEHRTRLYARKQRHLRCNT